MSQVYIVDVSIVACIHHHGVALHPFGPRLEASVRAPATGGRSCWRAGRGRHDASSYLHPPVSVRGEGGPSISSRESPAADDDAPPRG